MRPTFRDRSDAPRAEVELLAAEGAPGDSYSLRWLAFSRTDMADLPPERQWMRPYLRWGFATAAIGFAFIFGYLAVGFGERSPNLWLEYGFFGSAVAAFGVSMALRFRLGMRAAQMNRPPTVDRRI
jgi:hypothetical protein